MLIRGSWFQPNSVSASDLFVDLSWQMEPEANMQFCLDLVLLRGSSFWLPASHQA